MTRYTVLWDVDVESRFIQAWTLGDAAIRKILTEVANWVDHNLADDPDLKGIAREDLSVRIVTVPLESSQARVSVAYQVFPDDRQVRVVRLVFRL